MNYLCFCLEISIFLLIFAVSIVMFKQMSIKKKFTKIQ